MDLRFGAIVRDRHGDVGLVLGFKGDRIRVLWQDSGRVQEVLRKTITAHLGQIKPEAMYLDGSQLRGFLGMSIAALRMIRHWAPRFPTPVLQLEHAVVLHLSQSGSKPGPISKSRWLAFDQRCQSPFLPKIQSDQKRLLAQLENLLSLKKRLFAQLKVLVGKEHREGRLGHLDHLVRSLFSHDGHRAYTRVKRDIILQGEEFRFLSAEQRMASASTCLPTLVTARAGTGKTTTLVARAAALMKDFGVLPGEILILAFNKKAAHEIGKRLELQFPGKPVPAAMTFHALARRIVRPDSQPLVDEGGMELSRFIEDTIRENWTPHFEACIHAVLSTTAHEQWLENGLRHATDDQYLRYRLQLPYFTLRGERVKSAGEKAIADFYTRHGIGYQYEEGLKGDDGWFFPDFSLLHEGKLVVHEHWGISSDPSNRTVPQTWTRTYDEYCAQMKRKRAFLRQQGIPLLETWVDDLHGGKLAFESRLSSRLKAIGIDHHPLSDQEVMERIRPLQENRVDPKPEN